MKQEIKEKVFDLVLSVLKDLKEVSYSDVISLPRGGLYLPISTKVRFKDVPNEQKDLLFIEIAKRFVDAAPEMVGLRSVYYEPIIRMDDSMQLYFYETIIYIY